MHALNIYQGLKAFVPAIIHEVSYHGDATLETLFVWSDEINGGKRPVVIETCEGDPCTVPRAIWP